MTALGPEVSAGQGFAIELLITFVLVITVFATCDGSRNDLNGSGPLAIGLSVTMCHLGFVSSLFNKFFAIFVFRYATHDDLKTRKQPQNLS